MTTFRILSFHDFTGGVAYLKTPDTDSPVFSYPHSSEQLYRKEGAISTADFGYLGFKKGRNTRECGIMLLELFTLSDFI